MLIGDWSSDVCSSGLHPTPPKPLRGQGFVAFPHQGGRATYRCLTNSARSTRPLMPSWRQSISCASPVRRIDLMTVPTFSVCPAPLTCKSLTSATESPSLSTLPTASRSEEHTSELQSLMRISYAVFCLKKKKNKQNKQYNKYTLIQEYRPY